MLNNRQTYADYVWSQYKRGHPHYHMGVQEIVMTPAYENIFVLINNIFLFNAITFSCSLDVDHFYNWKKNSSLKSLFYRKYHASLCAVIL